MAEKVTCRECGGSFKALPVHLKTKHAMTVEEYRAKYPDSPIMTETVRENMNGHKDKSDDVSKSDVTPIATSFSDRKLYFGGQSLNVLEDDSHPLIPSHDPNYVFDPADERLEVIAYCVKRRQSLMFTGATGSGKTTLFKEMASVLNQPVRHISLSLDTEGTHFIGEDVIDVKDGSPCTAFRYGVLPKAMIEGSWLLIDEVDAACAGATLALQQVLNDGYLVMPSTAEVIYPHKMFRIFATANTKGKGEASHLYAGTHVMNEATLDRFLMYRAGYPKREIEIEIVKKYGVEEALAGKLIDIALDVRAAFDNEECLTTFSTRKLIAWAKAIAGLKDMRLATKIAVMDRTVDDYEFIHGVISRHITEAV